MCECRDEVVKRLDDGDHVPLSPSTFPSGDVSYCHGVMMRFAQNRSTSGLLQFLALLDRLGCIALYALLDALLLLGGGVRSLAAVLAVAGTAGALGTCAVGLRDSGRWCMFVFFLLHCEKTCHFTKQ